MLRKKAEQPLLIQAVIDRHQGSSEVSAFCSCQRGYNILRIFPTVFIQL